MAATIILKGCTSTNAATEATITAIMFRANDSVAVTKANPITIPATPGTVYSYEKWIRWYCSVGPDTQCTNFKFWGANAIPATGIAVFDGTTDTGVTPVTTVSAVATTQQDTTHYSLATALAVGGTVTAPAEETNYLVLQLAVSDTATQGDMPQQTFNYAYDEN
jgi:hypothetical protein